MFPFLYFSKRDSRCIAHFSTPVATPRATPSISCENKLKKKLAIAQALLHGFGHPAQSFVLNTNAEQKLIDYGPLNMIYCVLKISQLPHSPDWWDVATLHVIPDLANGFLFIT